MKDYVTAYQVNCGIANQMSHKHWQDLHYSGRGMREYVFRQALMEAIELGRKAEREFVMAAIVNHDLSDQCETLNRHLDAVIRAA